MIVAIEKPGSPEELVESLTHHGIKGMKWGHRKEQVTTAVSSRVPHLTDQQKLTAKKVAIGAGVAAVVVGSAFVAYKLNQSGKIALPHQSRSPATIDKLLAEHGKVRLNRKEFQRTQFRKTNKDVQLNVIKAMRLREKVQADRFVADREAVARESAFLNRSRKTADKSIDWNKISKAKDPIAELTRQTSPSKAQELYSTRSSITPKIDGPLWDALPKRRGRY